MLPVVRITVPPTYTSNMGAELVTYRTVHIELEAELPFAESASMLVKFDETVTYGSNRQFGWIEVANGNAIKYERCRKPLQTAVQKGSAVGYRSPPDAAVIAPPLFPQYLVKEPTVTPGTTSPRTEGRVHTVMASPTILHPAAPPAYLHVDHDATLTTSYQRLALGTLSRGIHYDFNRAGWGYGWGMGLNSIGGDWDAMLAMFGLEFQENRSVIRIGFTGFYTIALVGHKSGPLSGAITPPASAYEITMFRNGEVTALSASWSNLMTGTYNGDVETGELKAGDVIELRARLDDESDGSVNLRNIQMWIQPTVDPNGDLGPAN